ncbi:Cysteine--tRNA ligase [Blattella germanica]|nr:Cysteine--tRNA ligase [Blattella germanica]
MAKRTQPKWQPPERSTGPILKLFNSLTRQKEEFVPQNGRNVLWYSCGPTVYDASHMGHARSYISFDILRRVLSDYFGYDVMYVMNITDIDDKIIKRARQNYLYERYLAEDHSLKKNLDDAKNVLELFSETVKKATDPDKKLMLEKVLAKMTAAVEQLEIAVKSNDEGKTKEAQEVFLREARDPLSEWLDHLEGHTVTDNSIFTKLPRYWEAQFHEDMDALNKIIANGLAYESNGSVYFDVNGFDGREGHHYAKLVPEAYGDAKSLQDGEESLFQCTFGFLVAFHLMTEEVIMPYLSILAKFRDDIRNQARQLKATDILSECDRLRDDILPNVGVRLEDREEAEKAAEKERKKAEQAAAQAQRDAQKRIKPTEMFLSERDKYSQFDDKGIPTHDAEGKELSKGQIKKLQKLQQVQEKKYNEYLQSTMVNGVGDK